jgi:hypothetical protein
VSRERRSRKETSVFVWRAGKRVNVDALMIKTRWANRELNEVCACAVLVCVPKF